MQIRYTKLYFTKMVARKKEIFDILYSDKEGKAFLFSLLIRFSLRTRCFSSRPINIYNRTQLLMVYAKVLSSLLRKNCEIFLCLQRYIPYSPFKIITHTYWLLPLVVYIARFRKKCFMLLVNIF